MEILQWVMMTIKHDCPFLPPLALEKSVNSTEDCIVFLGLSMLRIPLEKSYGS